MSREIQNATDQVTEPVNIADAYDRYRSLNTQWNSSVLLEEKHSGFSSEQLLGHRAPYYLKQQTGSKSKLHG